MTVPMSASATTAKPRRALRRWRWIGGLVLTVIAIPFVYRCAVDWQRERELEQIYRELDAADPHWRWADLIAHRPPAAPDERNAALQMAKVRTLAHVKPHKMGASYPNARWSALQLQALRGARDKAGASALIEARKLKDMPDAYVQVPDDKPATTRFPNWIEWINVLHLLQVDVLVRSDEQDKDGAAESCLALFHAAHAMGDFPGMLPQNIRFAGQEIGVDALEHILGKGEVSEPQLAALQRALVVHAEFEGLYHGLRGERAAGQESYQLVRAGKAAEMLGGPPHRPFAAFMWSIEANNRMIHGYPDCLRAQNENVRISKLQDAGQADAARKHISDLERQSGRAREQKDHLQVEPQQVARGRLRSAIVAVAAERYRLAHGGAWPKSMAELVAAGLLMAPQKDPYDGQPLRWKTTPGNLIIYCVGPTQVDDGGQLNRFNVRPNRLGFVLFAPHMRGVLLPDADAEP